MIAGSPGLPSRWSPCGTVHPAARILTMAGLLILLLSPAGAARVSWHVPGYDADAYVAGPPLGEMMTRLAEDVPATYQNQYTGEILQLMDKAVYRVLDLDADPETELRNVAETIREKIATDRFGGQ